jgi:mono/diheme cytochrome c family protein
MKAERIPPLSALAVAFVLAVPTVATAGDVAAGAALARQWCSGCHVVDEARRGTDSAPPLTTIAKRHAADESWLRGWLAQPHPPMPNFNLDRREIDDIIAYLGSLRAD